MFVANKKEKKTMMKIMQKPIMKNDNELWNPPMHMIEETWLNPI